MDNHFDPDTTGRSPAINEILPAEVALYQEPIQVEKGITKDIQLTWDKDILSLMWNIKHHY